MSEYAFDDAGARVPVTGPDWDRIERDLDGPNGEVSPDDVRRIETKMLIGVIEMLLETATTPVGIGEVAMLIGHIMKCEGSLRKQKDLVAAFGVSAPRISVRVKTFRQKLKQMIPD